MTAHALYDFTVTVVPPAGTAPSTHTVRAEHASQALCYYDRRLSRSPINLIKGVSRVMVDGTIYIAALTNPNPVAPTAEAQRDEIPMSELEG